MGGVASGGNKLTPNRNVTAVAGNGGDTWGANGGGITPVGGGVTGQAGWNTPEDNALSTGQTQTNYLLAGTTPTSSTRSILSDSSRGAYSLQNADSALPTNRSTVG